MIEYMLDSDICIYVMKNRGTALWRRFDEADGRLSISSIAYGELRAGVEKSQRRADNTSVLETFIARIEIISFDATASQHYGDVRAKLEGAGTPIGPMDMLIGAHARSLGMTLVTNNRREFDRIADLKVENWV
jgi:tRNA(fMet)-specific endonuclease VapC